MQLFSLSIIRSLDGRNGEVPLAIVMPDDCDGLFGSTISSLASAVWRVDFEFEVVTGDIEDDVAQLEGWVPGVWSHTGSGIERRWQLVARFDIRDDGSFKVVDSLTGITVALVHDGRVMVVPVSDRPDPEEVTVSKRTTARQRVIARAEQLSLDVEDWGGCITLWAPKGNRFVTDQQHCIACPFDASDGVPKAKAWQDLDERSAKGIEPCACDVCTPEDTPIGMSALEEHQRTLHGYWNGTIGPDKALNEALVYIAELEALTVSQSSLTFGSIRTVASGNPDIDLHGMVLDDAPMVNEASPFWVESMGEVVITPPLKAILACSGWGLHDGVDVTFSDGSTRGWSPFIGGTLPAESMTSDRSWDDELRGLVNDGVIDAQLGISLLTLHHDRAERPQVWSPDGTIENVHVGVGKPDLRRFEAECGHCGKVVNSMTRTPVWTYEPGSFVTYTECPQYLGRFDICSQCAALLDVTGQLDRLASGALTAKSDPVIPWERLPLGKDGLFIRKTTPEPYGVGFWWMLDRLDDDHQTGRRGLGRQLYDMVTKDHAHVIAVSLFGTVDASGFVQYMDQNRATIILDTNPVNDTMVDEGYRSWSCPLTEVVMGVLAADPGSDTGLPDDDPYEAECHDCSEPTCKGCPCAGGGPSEEGTVSTTTTPEEDGWNDPTRHGAECLCEVCTPYRIDMGWDSPKEDTVKDLSWKNEGNGVYTTPGYKVERMDDEGTASVWGIWSTPEGEAPMWAGFTSTLKAAKAKVDRSVNPERPEYVAEQAKQEAESKAFWAREAEAYRFEPGERFMSVIDAEGTGGSHYVPFPIGTLVNVPLEGHTLTGARVDTLHVGRVVSGGVMRDHTTQQQVQLTKGMTIWTKTSELTAYAGPDIFLCRHGGWVESCDGCWLVDCPEDRRENADPDDPTLAENEGPEPEEGTVSTTDPSPAPDAPEKAPVDRLAAFPVDRDKNTTWDGVKAFTVVIGSALDDDPTNYTVFAEDQLDAIEQVDRRRGGIADGTLLSAEVDWDHLYDHVLCPLCGEVFTFKAAEDDEPFASWLRCTNPACPGGDYTMWSDSSVSPGYYGDDFAEPHCGVMGRKCECGEPMVMNVSCSCPTCCNIDCVEYDGENIGGLEQLDFDVSGVSPDDLGLMRCDECGEYFAPEDDPAVDLYDEDGFGETRTLCGGCQDNLAYDEAGNALDPRDGKTLDELPDGAVVGAVIPAQVCTVCGVQLCEDDDRIVMTAAGFAHWSCRKAQAIDQLGFDREVVAPTPGVPPEVVELVLALAEWYDEGEAPLHSGAQLLDGDLTLREAVLAARTALANL